MSARLASIRGRGSAKAGPANRALWLAVSVLTELYPRLDGWIGYGGIGAPAIPFDERLDRGHLAVPTFGNIPPLPTVGSGHSIQNHRKTA
jgi:cephalosporin-C deacetylase